MSLLIHITISVTFFVFKTLYLHTFKFNSVSKYSLFDKDVREQETGCANYSTYCDLLRHHVLAIITRAF